MVRWPDLPAGKWPPQATLYVDLPLAGPPWATCWQMASGGHLSYRFASAGPPGATCWEMFSGNQFSHREMAAIVCAPQSAEMRHTTCFHVEHGHSFFRLIFRSAAAAHFVRQSTWCAEKWLQSFLHRNLPKFGFVLSSDLPLCELLRFGPRVSVRCRNGQLVKESAQAKYLGCYLNSKGNLDREVSQRIAAATTTWKRLDASGRHAHVDLKFKLQAYNAIVVAKVLHGLETAQLTQSTQRAFYIFSQNEASVRFSIYTHPL